ncbi:hypothetical protein [Halomontanus rarus]|uniref:hypothetical protein n=1 Tax=Halomontanus rarus TaxID=3034020 RepID=UPI0023E78FF7|nr:hypothetical protein [Halovivax sp. TS33]
MNETLHQRIERRLREDLQLEPADVNGVMEIVHEEVDPIDYTLEQWSCDRCGDGMITAHKGDEALCNGCIFGDEPIQQGESE